MNNEVVIPEKSGIQSMQTLLQRFDIFVMHLKKIGVCICIVLSMCLFFNASPAQASSVSVALQIPILHELKIPICQSHFEPGPDGKPHEILECTGIAKYIAIVYQWAVAFAAILAVVAFSYAGVLWLTAGGDSGKVTESKKVMGNALIGLLLALGSYLLLNLINPNLVTFKAIRVPGITTVDLELVAADIEDHADAAARCASAKGLTVAGYTHVTFDTDSKKDIEASGVVTQVLADTLTDIDKAGYNVTVTTLVSGHHTGKTLHNPGGRAADICADQTTLSKLADYLGAQNSRLKVNELFYAYNTNQTYDNCAKQGSDWLKNTKYTKPDGTVTTLYEAHTSHLHVGVGCGTGSFPKK